MILPINGEYGNLNEVEGARAVGVVKPKLAIPCHYWNFAEHGGNPNTFAQQMKSNCPEIKYNLMRIGETVKI